MKTIVSRLFAFVLAFLAIPAFACGDGSCNPPPPPAPNCGPTACSTTGGLMGLKALTNIAAWGGKVEGASNTAWLMTADLGYNDVLETQDFVASAGQLTVEFKGKEISADTPLAAGSFVEFMAEWVKKSYW